MYGCESWTVKKAEHRRMDAFEQCVGVDSRVSWTARRSNQSILKENSPKYSLEGLMLMLKLPILWPPDAKNWFIVKDPDAGKDWRREEKGPTYDVMVGWHHRLNGHEFELAPWVGDGQGGLACCNRWGCKESDTTEWLNWLTYRWIQYLPYLSPHCSSSLLSYWGRKYSFPVYCTWHFSAFSWAN